MAGSYPRCCVLDQMSSDDVDAAAECGIDHLVVRQMQVAVATEPDHPIARKVQRRARRDAVLKVAIQCRVATGAFDRAQPFWKDHPRMTVGMPAQQPGVAVGAYQPTPRDSESPPWEATKPRSSA